MKKRLIMCCAVLCLGAIWSVRAELDDTQEVDDSSQVRTSVKERGSQLLKLFQLCKKCADDDIRARLKRLGLMKGKYPEVVLKTVMNMYNSSHSPQYGYKQFLNHFNLRQKRSVTTS